MTIPVLICDDSAFARKAIARSLPDAWDITISFAENGQEALDAIRSGKGDIMFLDLNMPVMDGYETMEHIKKNDLNSMVIVISGDVQDEARLRMKKLGAIDFIRKPIDNQKLTDILRKYGLFDGNTSTTQRSSQSDVAIGESLEDKLDTFRELANVSMGQAGANLAKLLDRFIQLPVPNVSLINVSELAMSLAAIDERERVSALSKGFASKYIKGEAIIVFNNANVESVKKFIGNGDSTNNISDIEVLMDVSNIIIGACLNGLAAQLNTKFTHCSPMVLGVQVDLDEVIASNENAWEKVLMIEIAYSIKSENIYFDLLLVIPSTEMDKTFSHILASRDN